MKIAVIGQSLFGADVYKLLQKDGHKIVGVFTVPDVNGKPDPLGKVFFLRKFENCLFANPSACKIHKLQ